MTPAAPANLDSSRVSVVMPVYNAETTLLRSMLSVLQQTHAELELLVVDDGSRDGSLALMQRQAAIDARVVAISLPRNAGVAAARNAGIEAASGDYVAFLDSDDWWHPRKLEVQLATMHATGARVAYADYQRVGEDGRVLSQVHAPGRVDYRDMLRSNHIGNLTGIYQRSLGALRFEAVGHEDYVFWLQAVKHAGSAVCAPHPEPLAYYLVRAGSLSADKLKAARWQWHIYRRIERLGLLHACWYFMHYGINALAKRR